VRKKIIDRGKNVPRRVAIFSHPFYTVRTMKQTTIALVLASSILFIGAGCSSSAEISAEQAKRDALIAKTKEVEAQQAAPSPASAPAATAGPTDGTYCWDKAPKLCHKISFTAGTVELVVGGKASGDEFKLTKNPSGKYSFTATEINSATFLTVKDVNTLEVVTLTTGTSGSTTSPAQTWVRK